MKITKRVFTKAWKWAVLQTKDYENRWFAIAAFNAGYKTAKREVKK